MPIFANEISKQLNFKRMITYKELKEFTAKCNVKHELNPRYCDSEYYSTITHKWERVQLGWYFGMNNISGKSGQNEWQWVWFSCLDDEITDESVFFFVERYSQMVGRSYKGIREDIRACETIKRRMN